MSNSVVQPNTVIDTDEALMLAFAAGDMTAFDELYARHRHNLYAFLAREIPAAYLDNLFQDIWVRVMRSRMSYQTKVSFRAWLFQIARNLIIDLRREKSLPVVRDLASAKDDRGLSADPEGASNLWRGSTNFQVGVTHGNPGTDKTSCRSDQTLAAKQEILPFERALASLPPPQRETFLLREHAGLSLEEIARLTGVNAETAKSRLRYALNKLMAALGGV